MQYEKNIKIGRKNISIVVEQINELKTWIRININKKWIHLETREIFAKKEAHEFNVLEWEIYNFINAINQEKYLISGDKDLIKFI